jgi:serine protease
MRIAIEDQALTTSAYGGGSGSTHWRVNDWDQGTTEGGSSGSGLWNQNKRLVGQLHGGSAACGNNLSDYYGRLSVSWTGGGSAATRLRDWLDPANSGQTAIAGYRSGTTPPPPPPPTGTLTNGVAVTGLSAAANGELRYTLSVPAGASALSFVTSGGTGDADLYVRFGSAPTTTTYDCRPYQSGNAETCSFATPQAGTYHVMVRAYSAISGVSLIGSYSTGGGGTPSFFENTADYAINDNATVESPITVSGRSGNAPANLQVAVRILHTYKGDLKVDLVAPNGTVYVLHNRTGGSTDNVIGTFTVNASAVAANGVWKLRVNDNAGGDTGTLDSWSLRF